MSKIHKRGFTLIELLVVVAIVAILAAILFPVFQKVRENARRTACMSNLKQVALGVIQYQQDNDEFYVLTERGGDVDDAHEYYWGDMLQPYLKSWAVLTCPDAPNPTQFKTGVTTYSQQWSYHYGINDVTANITACNPDGTNGPDTAGCQHVGVAGQLLARVSAPAVTVLIVDAVPYDLVTGPTLGAPSLAGPSNDPNALSQERHEVNWQVGHRDSAHLSNQGQLQDGYPRHADGFVLVMADGHAKWRRRTFVNGIYGGGTTDMEWLAAQP